MKVSEVMHAWYGILAGRRPALSIEITRECPLRCPGCYAYDSAHLGSGINLRQLSDFRGDDLVARILALVDEHRPQHLSLVGGDPLVRYRELDELLPILNGRGVHVQVVTSAFRVIPRAWNDLDRLNIVVSIDGLAGEHDVRRKPATYERILKNTSESRITVHCTITSQILQRDDYLEEFVDFWSMQPQTKRVWFSIFTPQMNATDPEILSSAQRQFVMEELLRLRDRFPLLDMNPMLIREIMHPPSSPKECIFAQTTTSISADLKTRISPCQFGGNPDCSQCGCIASLGLAALGHYQPVPGVTAGRLFTISQSIAKGLQAVGAA